MERYSNVLSIISNRQLDAPLHIFRPHLITLASKFFLQNFAGKVAYAVKANADKYVLEALYKAGITSFDVASLEEIKLLRGLLPDSCLYFMHTVKSRQAISAAYHEYGIKDFSLDSFIELSKILQETNFAKDLHLYIRIAVPNIHAKVSLAGKFGIEANTAVDLLKEARKYSKKLAVSFHVGSQCSNPEAYKIALRIVAEIIDKSQTQVDIINVGGGFPSVYEGMDSIHLKTYFEIIHEEFSKISKKNSMELMCEPGRALVAESGATIVRVELIKGRNLYINDGTYGGLFDAGIFNLIYPVKIIRIIDNTQVMLSPFSFFGPTCDAIDFMKGPFYLPHNIKEGEYFEIGQLGAYSRSLATKFNGFIQAEEVVIVEDQPLMSLYTTGRIFHAQKNNQKFYSNNNTMEHIKSITNSKAQILSQEIQHIDITSFDARPIIESMEQMSFTSRDLARATNIFNQMLQDKDCTIILTLAGSTSAGGCMKLYADLIKYNMVDAVVATGASIVDMDFFEALGFKHYRGNQFADDNKLRDLMIDRIYDTYINEEDLKICDHTICEIADQLAPKSYTSRAFIREMGKFLSIKGAKKQESLVQLAYEHDVPIFCPAFTDSSAGFGLVVHQIKNPNNHITMDSIGDFKELTEIKIQAKKTGLLMIGGGVPKNFTQDTVVCAEILGHKVDMHKYAIQITVADSRDGACSSSTLKEACSWGKVDKNLEQMVYAEVTSVLPLLASDAYHRGYWKNRQRQSYAKLFLGEGCNDHD